MKDKKSRKATALSGFPEWLPEQMLVEQQIVADIRRKFELFGFTPLDTRSVEPLDTLLAKGEVDKEIYVLRRLHANDGEDDKDLALHFDLTVPFARYVAQHRSRLTYPFKRYQLQRVWRGERPQQGRYREFYQADIDVVAEDTLPLWFDAEMPMLLHEVLSSLPIPPVRILVNNRKILEGAYRAVDIEDVVPVLRIVDKVEKIGEDGVRGALIETLGLSPRQAETCVALGRIRRPDAGFVDDVRALGVSGELLDEGLQELAYVMDCLSDIPAGLVVADLHIARGLDYYTGTVYEGIMEGHESLGAVCSGGRYDNLVDGGKIRLPGVGVSIGVSRILGRLFGEQALASSRSTPTCVLVALPAEEHRGEAIQVARTLRGRGISAEVFHAPVKYSKQIRYADRKGIPYVWFIGGDAGHEVRDIRAGEQHAAAAGEWTPDARSLHPRIVVAGDVPDPSRG